MYVINYTLFTWAPWDSEPSLCQGNDQCGRSPLLWTSWTGGWSGHWRIPSHVQKVSPQSAVSICHWGKNGRQALSYWMQRQIQFILNVHIKTSTAFRHSHCFQIGSMPALLINIIIIMIYCVLFLLEVHVFSHQFLPFFWLYPLQTIKSQVKTGHIDKNTHKFML